MYQRAISHSLCPLRKKKEEDDLDHYYHKHLCKNPRSFVIFSEKMSEEEGKVLHHHHHHHQQYDQQEQPQPQYGTFQGVANYPPQPVIGFPQPVPPPGSAEAYAHGYQAVPVYTVAEGRPVRERRLPCCGLGFGWFLFIIGFFLAAIPWYVGAIILLCVRAVDYREKPGYIACMVAAVLATIAVIFGATSDDW